MQAVEGKKVAQSWGATFMESSARDNQVLNVKIRLGGKASPIFLTRCLAVGIGSVVLASGTGWVARLAPWR